MLLKPVSFLKKAAAGGSFVSADLFGASEGGFILTANTSQCFSDTGASVPAGVGDAVLRWASPVNSHTFAISGNNRFLRERATTLETYVEFDQTLAGKYTGTSVSSVSATGYTLWVAFRPSVIASNDILLQSSNRMEIRQTDSSGTFRIRSYDGVAATFDVSATGLSAGVDTTLIGIANTTQAEGFKDGSSVGTAANPAGTFPTTAADFDISTTSASTTSGMDIYEVGCINRPITSGERANLQTYLEGLMP